MRTGKAVALAGVATVAVVLAGCGTRVPGAVDDGGGTSLGATGAYAGQGAATGPAQGSASAPGAAVAGEPAGQGAAAQGGTAVATAGTATGTGVSATGAPVTGPTAAGQATAPGSTTGKAAGKPGAVSTAKAASPVAAKAAASPVNVGFTILPDAGAFASSLGASDSTGDENAEVMAAVTWVNAHGGLAGHPINPKIESVSVTSSQSYDSQYQQLCQKFTQDDHVVAATIQPTGADDNMDACMTAAHTLFVTGGSGAEHNQADYAQHPYVVSPSEPTVPGLAKAMAGMVLQRNAVPKGGKLGIIYYDFPEYDDAVNNDVKPELAAAGIGIEPYTVPPLTSTGDVGSAISTVESAELKFRTENIQTVMFLCPSCLAVFASSAKTQGYHPAYVFSSMDTPSAGNDASLFTTSFGVGFEPVMQDQLDYSNPGGFTGNPTFDRCKQIETAAGQATSDTALATSVALCDAVMSIYSAAQANPTATITADSLRQGMLSEGGRYPSALTFSTDLTPQNHAGDPSYRTMQWSTSCSCLAYYGAVQTFQVG